MYRLVCLNSINNYYTYLDEGKIAFPHKEKCDVKFVKDITMLADYNIEHEISTTAFFTGREVEMEVPTFSDLMGSKQVINILINKARYANAMFVKSVGIICSGPDGFYALITKVEGNVLCNEYSNTFTSYSNMVHRTLHNIYIDHIDLEVKIDRVYNGIRAMNYLKGNTCELTELDKARVGSCAAVKQFIDYIHYPGLNPLLFCGSNFIIYNNEFIYINSNNVLSYFKICNEVISDISSSIEEVDKEIYSAVLGKYYDQGFACSIRGMNDKGFSRADVYCDISYINIEYYEDTIEYNTDSYCTKLDIIKAERAAADIKAADMILNNKIDSPQYRALKWRYLNKLH